MKDRASVKGLLAYDGCNVVDARLRTSARFLLGFGFAATACGPSFQAVYEGNARFEHCYALEENPTSTMPDRATCWRDWSERYTYGQTRDRIHYATARYVALSQGMNAPTDEALMMAAPGETPRASTITAPTPTSALAPPPKVLDPVTGSTAKPVDPTTQEGLNRITSSGHPGEAVNVPAAKIDAGAPAPQTPAVVLPSGSCSDGCASDYRACSGACEGDAGAAQKAKCTKCTRGYKTCMSSCFR